MVVFFTLLASIVGFVILSGFLAMVDAAVLSVSAGEVGELVEKKRWGAQSLRSIARRRTRAIIVIVILTNITNIVGPILIGGRAAHLYSNVGIGVVTALLTVITIVFSEIIPKAIGTHYAPTIARVVAPAISLLIIVLYPLVRALEYLTQMFKRGRRKIGTEEQIKALVSIGGGAGHIQQDESDLIRRSFVLNDRKAEDIMTPVTKTVAMPEDRTVRLAAKMVFRSVYSRYPVYGETIDDIRGYVMSRDVLSALADGQDHLPLSAITREILSVSHTMTANKLLDLFKRKQIHIAVVKNRKHTVGIVTLEDVLEELVGEIEDEGDKE